MVRTPHFLVTRIGMQLVLERLKNLTEKKRHGHNILND